MPSSRRASSCFCAANPSCAVRLQPFFASTSIQQHRNRLCMRSRCCPSRLTLHPCSTRCVPVRACVCVCVCICVFVCGGECDRETHTHTHSLPPCITLCCGTTLPCSCTRAWRASCQSQCRRCCRRQRRATRTTNCDAGGRSHTLPASSQTSAPLHLWLVRE